MDESASRDGADPRHGRAVGSPASRVLVAAAALTVLSQVAYPLLSGTSLRVATLVSVVLFALTCVLHAAATCGTAAAARLVLVAGGLGLAAEAVGVRTGVPFGGYAYAGSLGPQLLGVPIVVPLAWTMMAWPALVLARHLTGHRDRRRPRTVALGALTLAAWDLYLDPQMVAAGHWRWSDPHPALPGIPGIPLSNYAGWLLVGLLIVACLDAAVPRRRLTVAEQAVPAALLAWTWLGSGLAAAAFFGRPASAAWGLVVMGLTVLPYLWSLSRGQDPRPATTPARVAAR